jgi:hypothetical protein
MKKVLLISMGMLFGIALMGGDTKISGDTHFGYNLKSADESDFAISRAYFTVQSNLSDNLSFKFQTDVGSGSPSDFTVYLKNAKLDWKTELGLMTLGLQGLNTFGVQESTWGYRFIEKSAMDRKKFASSADIGLGFEKKLSSITSSLIVSNGTGYKKKEDDAHKKVSFRLLYGESKLKKGFNVGLISTYEANDYENISASDTSIAKGHTIVVGGFGGALLGSLRVGGEFNRMTSTNASSYSKTLLSVYTNYPLGNNLSVFGRVDAYSTDVSGNGELYVVAGLNYQPEKQLHIAPNIAILTKENEDTSLVYRLNFRLSF